MTSATIKKMEDDVVEAWRLHELVEAGYAAENAMLIALDFTIDLHAACDLLKNGCDQLVATQILV